MTASPQATLATEQQHVSDLIALMKQEQQCLVTADADALAGLTPRKTQLVQELAMLSKRRHAALAAAGREAGEAGMEPWLAAADNAQARKEWERLLELTREAKELNRVNGMLINKQLAHTQGMLGALRAPAGAAGAGAMYGASGQPVSGGASKRYVVG